MTIYCDVCGDALTGERLGTAELDDDAPILVCLKCRDKFNGDADDDDYNPYIASDGSAHDTYDEMAAHEQELVNTNDDDEEIGRWD